MIKSNVEFHFDENAQCSANFTDVHDMNQFTDFIQKMATKNSVIINFPVIKWKFDNDSIDNFISAVLLIKNVHGKTPIIVHIPEMKDEEVIKSNTVMFYQNCNRVCEITPKEAYAAYTTGPDGQYRSAPKNYNFVTMSHFFVSH